MLDLDVFIAEPCLDTKFPEEALGKVDSKRSAHLLSVLARCPDVLVRWRPGERLIVRVKREDGDVEIPWHVAETKKTFRSFAQALETMVASTPSATEHESTRFAEMMSTSPGLRQAFDNLHGALVQRA